MKKLLLLLTVLLFPAIGHAQGGGFGPFPVYNGVGVPSGACQNGALYTDNPTGDLYSCKANAWIKVGSGGGGGTISGCSTANGVLYNSGSANTATCGANFQYIASTKELFAYIDGDFLLNNSGTGNLFTISGTTGLVTPIGGVKFALTAKSCFYGSTGQACIIGASGAAGTPADLILPTTSGTSGYFLQTDGAGTLSWASGGHTICSGQISLSTGAIGSGARATNTLSCTGLLTTDTISCTFSGDTNAVTGYAPSANGGLFLKTYVTADTVNVDQVNDTLLSITPGAATVNCRGTR